MCYPHGQGEGPIKALLQASFSCYPVLAQGNSSHKPQLAFRAGVIATFRFCQCQRYSTKARPCHANKHLQNLQRVGIMPRDMSGTGRYPPTPKHQPAEFYGTVRLGDPERLFHVMSLDPYFATQDNGAGAPIQFATTYKQLDMVHHLLNNGAEINQRDDKGLTALHKAASGPVRWLLANIRVPSGEYLPYTDLSARV